jgi:hypothetical protein
MIAMTRIPSTSTPPRERRIGWMDSCVLVLEQDLAQSLSLLSLLLAFIVHQATYVRTECTIELSKPSTYVNGTHRPRFAQENGARVQGTDSPARATNHFLRSSITDPTTPPTLCFSRSFFPLLLVLVTKHQTCGTTHSCSPL